MKRVVLTVVFVLGLVRVLHAAAPAELDLKGAWQLRLDCDGSAAGEALSKEEFKERITLPASLTAQGLGDEVGPDTPWVGTVNDKAMEDPRLAPYLKQDGFKFPFWLQPERYYRGAAWYQRQVNIPASGTLRLLAALAGGAEVALVEAASAIDGESRVQELVLPLGKDMRLWDEFNPWFYQLLDLHDFPGQGTALVGVLDAFWDCKGYITAEQYRRFCAPTVPLARLDRMIWTDGETVEADVEIAHFGAKDLTSAVVAWKLLKPDGKALVSGAFPARAIRTGQNTDSGTIMLFAGMRISLALSSGSAEERPRDADLPDRMVPDA